VALTLYGFGGFALPPVRGLLSFQWHAVVLLTEPLGNQFTGGLARMQAEPVTEAHNRAPHSRRTVGTGAIHQG